MRSRLAGKQQSVKIIRLGEKNIEPTEMLRCCPGRLCFKTWSTDLRSAECSVVAAAGNAGTNELSFPVRSSRGGRFGQPSARTLAVYQPAATTTSKGVRIKVFSSSGRGQGIGVNVNEYVGTSTKGKTGLRNFIFRRLCLGYSRPSLGRAGALPRHFGGTQI